MGFTGCSEHEIKKKSNVAIEKTAILPIKFLRDIQTPCLYTSNSKI
jgi:hypothetical protein